MKQCVHTARGLHGRCPGARRRHQRVIPKLGSAVNNGMLCSRGRFGYEFVGDKDRLTVPLIRQNGALAEATWRRP